MDSDKDCSDGSSDGGYKADGEPDANSISSNDSWTCRTSKRKRQENSIMDHERKGENESSSSLLVLSKLLEQYWDATRLPTRTTESPPKKQRCSTPKRPCATIPPSVSHECLSLDDALNFTPFARILLEAKAPYRVVHANAAYARSHGSISYHEASESFSSPEAAIMGYFGPLDKMTMYPVSGGSTRVTHYLAEASCSEVKAHHMHAVG